jgi:formylglycine-generating enzyme required for sulfatase activity
VLESELALPVGRIYDHHMSWAQWFNDSHVPGILWNKWFERRHMMHQIRRWDWDHSSELHTAWQNGSGMLIWENVFGTWMPWKERDKFWLRMMAPVQRKFNFLFTGEGWSPLYPVMAADVYANHWYNEGHDLWTLVNRSTERKSGILLKIPYREGMFVFNLFSGKEIETGKGDSIPVRLEIGPRGLGAILAIEKKLTGSGFFAFLENQKELFNALKQPQSAVEIREILINPKMTVKPSRIPENMALIESIPEIIEISYRQRECGFYGHQGYTSPPDRIHQQVNFTRKVEAGKYAIDLTPVTNDDFYSFMIQSGYRPRDTVNFLNHWIDGRPPDGFLDHPVVYVSLEDARTYAEWAGKRLPSEEEWQIAAQGTNNSRYPWGNSYDGGKCNSGRTNGTTPVRQFPEGRSSHGCYDMCGNTWEWTESERTDGHTRYVILKGGSWYKAEGSDWYFDGGPQPAGFAAKYILWWPRLDRSPVIGFRCAVDVDE